MNHKEYARMWSWSTLETFFQNVPERSK